MNSLDSRVLVRKAVHSAVCLLVLAGALTVAPLYVISACVLLALLFLVLRFVPLPAIVRFPERKSYGEVVLPLGLAGTVLVGHAIPHLMVATICILAFADPAAELFGVPGVKKSLRGSIAFFLVSVVILFATAVLMRGSLDHTFLARGLFIAGAGTIAERYSTSGWDNVSIPMVVSVLLYLFTQQM